MTSPNTTAAQPDTLQDTPVQDPNSTVVTLEQPIRRGNDSISSITLRKPKTGALRGLKLSELLTLDVESLIKLLPRISSPVLTEADIHNLEPADFTQLATGVIGFFVSTTTPSPTA